jgi:branched-chain amino acid aminotransferase
VWIGPDCVRAFPDGTGDIKAAGNYAIGMRAQVTAAAAGCDQVVWVDAVERRWVEEMGTMNLFLVLRDGALGGGGRPCLVTPPLAGTILAGATRDSILRLAHDAGFATEERRISVDEWRSAAADGTLAEAFACGTAAVVVPIGSVCTPDAAFRVGDGATGPVTRQLRDTLLAVQHGREPDAHGWLAGVPV